MSKKLTHEQILLRQYIKDLLKNYINKEVAKMTGFTVEVIKNKRKQKSPCDKDISYYRRLYPLVDKYYLDLKECSG